MELHIIYGNGLAVGDTQVESYYQTVKNLIKPTTLYFSTLNIIDRVRVGVKEGEITFPVYVSHLDQLSSIDEDGRYTNLKVAVSTSDLTLSILERLL